MPNTSVNLAARPFVNASPIRRLAILLWTIAVALTVLTVGSYWSYFAGSAEEARSELESTADEIGALEAELAEIDRRIARVDLEAMNAEVTFLNQRIARRTFGWSQLFDDLAEVLPAEVRFERLSPVVSLDRITGERRVVLGISGVARRDDALLELIDAFFRHPRFRDPDPEQEARRDGDLRFSLDVIYLPAAPSGSEDAS